MLASAELKPFLQQRYDRAGWVPVLRQLFGADRTEFFAPAAVAELPVGEALADRVAAMRQFGYVELGEPTFFGAQHRLALVEVELKGGKTLIARNRVGLRALTYPYVDDVRAHGVLAFYYDPEQADYRLSFQTRLAQGRGTSSSPDFVGTERRRYTFVLGPHEAARTAADRLAELGRRAGRTTLENVLGAFSVERLGTDFFKRYKGFYEEFIQQLNDNSDYRRLFKLDPKPAKNLYELEDKPLRDFAKRLLGRLVFLHFLQKKGWMGCSPDRKDWTGGSPEFLLDLFKPFREANRPDFYSAALVPLFFDTLSRKRAGDLFRVMGMSGPCRVPYLNGGLFEEEKIEDEEIEVRRIDFPAELFGRLLDFFAQYNFTIEENRPEDHDVGIDPEMLGHIFENLLEENRTKGAIYTPRPIVRYMCQESLIGYLHGRLSKEGVDRATMAAFVREHDVQPPLRDRAGFVEKLLEDVRICDPAIGSGAFPIGLLQELFAARLYLYPYLSNERRRAFDPAEVKKSIVARNIYGVDLDSGAVDIARLRFWLALVVDEAEPVPLPNLDFKVMQGNSLLESFERVDLSQLSNPDAGDGDMLLLAERGQLELGAEVSKSRQPLLLFSGKKKTDLLADIAAFFEADADRKRVLREQIRAAVDACLHAEMERDRLRLQDEVRAQQAFLTERLGPDFATLLKPTSPLARKYQRSLEALEQARAKENRLLDQHRKTDRPYFLWHLYFKDVFDRGGFDIVIANPPYMRVQETRKGQPDVKPEYEHYYHAITGGAYDLANLFVAQTLGLLNNPDLPHHPRTNPWRVPPLLHPQGTACFIFPHKFFNAEAGGGLRRQLNRGRHLHRIAHFGANPVFNGVNTYVCIAQFGHTPADAFRLLRLPYPTPAEHYTALLTDESRFANVPYATLRDAAELYSPVEAYDSPDPEKAATHPWLLMESAAEYELLKTLYAADVGDTSQNLSIDQRQRYTLGDNVDIFVGLQTSYDDLYVLRVTHETATHYHGHNDVEPERPWTVEKALWKPWLRGRDVHRYEPLPAQPKYVVLFPYTIEQVKKRGQPEPVDKAVPVPPDVLREQYKSTYTYVDHYRDQFPGSGKGRVIADTWYKYQYPKSLLEQMSEEVQLSSMEICITHTNLTINDGRYYNNSKVYGWIKLDGLDWSYHFLLAVANSRVLWWFLKRTGDTLQGDARTLKTNYLNPFPLPRRVPALYQEALATLARQLLWLHDDTHAPAVSNLPNRAVADFFRDVADLGVCELYLGDAMAEKRLDILEVV